METAKLQDMAGAVGLRDVRYGYDGENHVKAKASDGTDNFRWMAKDETNPYFTYDPSKCIVCSRCVRACEEVQGTFALTIEGRGFESRVSPGVHESFLGSECVSCGACVQACPTGTLQEKSIIEIGQPEHSLVTTCAYCGVGCSFKAEMRGDELVRMLPYKEGKANHGHSCVKGRFAYGYANHGDRILNPMIREKTSDPLARGHLGRGLRPCGERVPPAAIPAMAARASASSPPRAAPTRKPSSCRSSRAPSSATTTPTPAPACAIRPPATASARPFGTSAGTQDFDSVEQSDVILVIGANPTDGHPVFGSRLKKRIREGARLIVIDPRRIDLVRTPHVEAAHHLALRPWHQCRRADRARPRHRDREALRRDLHPRALQLGRVPGLGRIRFAAREQPRGKSASFPASIRKRSGVPQGSMPPAATVRSTTASASPSTARAPRP